MKTKLILVEGIPGSGKSTFAQRIANFYTQCGQKTTLYNEGDFHPADLAWNAYIPVEKLDSILAPYENFRDEIDKHIHIEGNYAIVPYTQVKTKSQPFLKDMEAYEVYNNRVPFEVFGSLHRKRWAAFSQLVEHKDELTIFECAFLQNHVSELMLWQLAELETIRAHCHALMQTVMPLFPTLIYLTQPSVKETVERVARQRVSARGLWVDEFIRSTENTPYGKLHKVRGFDDAIQYLEKRKNTELEIIKSLPVRTIVLENSNYDWEALWKTLESGLPM